MIEELNGDFLQWLRGFYYIVQTGSIRGAAQMMNRNPSTISYQLRSLEQELGTVLFDRYKRGLQITPEGERLLEWTISTFETLRGMRSDVSATPGTLQGSIIISSNLPFAVQAVGIVSKFYEKYPKTQIRMRRALDQGVIEDVESSRVDFGLVALVNEPDGSNFEELFKSRPLLIVNQENKYKLPARPTQEDLHRLKFVSFLSEQLEPIEAPQLGPDTANWNTGTPVLSVNNYHLMLRYVSQGVGVAVMDEMCLKSSQYGEHWGNIVSYPMDDFFPTVRYGILVRKKKHLSPQAKGLMEDIRHGFIKD